MKIPSGLAAREDFYQNLIEKCLFSRNERQMKYSFLRGYYLFGYGPEEEECPYNKIYPHLDLLSSFLFSADTTKFSISLGPDQPESEYLKVPVLTKEVNKIWVDSNLDRVFSMALDWALVYNSMFVKLIWKNGGLHPFPVEPGCFGVLREDTPFTDRQEALVHTYYITASQLERELENHPQKDLILKKISAGKESQEEVSSGLQRIMLSATNPNIQGNAVTPFTPREEYNAKVMEETIEMQELWFWCDEIEDYHVVTRAENQITIYDRGNFFVKGEHPFVQICPNPMYSYYWGMSEVSGLVTLQRWRNDRIFEMRKLLAKQVDPPTALSGWLGQFDEKSFALNRPGGILSGGEPMSKIDSFKPEIPSDLFREIKEIDEMFSERSGMQNTMMGKGETGVRSGRQTENLARLGSARTRKRALVIEDALEKIATLVLKCIRVYSKDKFKDEEQKVFIANQFTEDFSVKVDGHSSSPVFVEDHKQMAAELFEAKAIDREELIDMLDPPGKELMKRKLKIIEAKEMKMAQIQMAQEQQNKAAKE